MGQAPNLGRKPLLAKEITIPLGVVVERQIVDHPWAEDRWMPVSVFPGETERPPWSEMMRGDRFVRYHAGIHPLTLYRADTQAYRENLKSSRPAVYVVLSPGENPAAPCPLDVRLVTVSPYEMQDYLDAGEDIIEPVDLPESLAALMAEFVDQHHVDAAFKKRKRDRFAVEEEKFGQEPIFKQRRGS